MQLTYNGSPIELPDDLHWRDEFAWSPVKQETEYSITGALLIDAAVCLAGQPITLESSERHAWVRRATVKALKAWEAVPGREMTLELRGEVRSVVFDHANKGVTAEPVDDYADPADADWCRLVLRFLTV